MKSSRKLFFGAVAVLLASTPLFGQAKVPVKNWTVPPFDASMFNQSGPGIRPMTHTQGNNPAVFVPFGPCRLTDSRVSSGGPGPIAGGGTRDYDFVPSGCPFISGLQANQTVSEPIIAWSLNFTVINTAGPGFLYAYPTGGTAPPVSILNYTGADGEIRNNAAIVPVNGMTGSFTVGAGVSATDVIIDVNGVFLNELEPETQFVIVANIAGLAAILGYNNSNANGSHAGGFFAGGTGTVHGVQGQTGSGSGARSSGVHGIGGSAAAYTAGVFGESPTAFSGAGVKGVCGLNAAITTADDVWGPGGVRGLGTNFGVVGISDSLGAGGFKHNPAGGALQTGSFLGYSSTVGLHTIGTTSATGAKAFVEPHPTDASKMIRYISLEGPEAGTYFRGRGRFQNGTARIEVPEDFRFVTDPEGLTVQITPIGAMATVAVLRMDLNEIVAQGSRNVEFSYLVQGVRHSFKDVQPIMENDAYRPISPEFRMPEGYAPEQKRILVENGTYRADGGVNMETATRLGWDKIWEKRNPPAPAPNPE